MFGVSPYSSTLKPYTRKPVGGQQLLKVVQQLHQPHPFPPHHNAPARHKCLRHSLPDVRCALADDLAAHIHQIIAEALHRLQLTR